MRSPTWTSAAILFFLMLACLLLAVATSRVGVDAQEQVRERFRLHETGSAGLVLFDTETGTIHTFAQKDTGNVPKAEDWARGLVKRREIR